MTGERPVAIDAEQRRIAERATLQALRRFHREQPMAADLRMDSLVARVRAAAPRPRPAGHRGSGALTLDDVSLRTVIDGLVADGRVVRTGRRLRLAEVPVGLDPAMAEKVDVLLEGLRAAWANPPRVDGIAARLGIPPAVVDQLRSSGRLRSIAAGIDYPADVWSSLRARVEELPGTVSVARLRDELRTSRRHAEAILAAVASSRPTRGGGTAPRRPPRPRT
jgi:hypothetical protein